MFEDTFGGVQLESLFLAYFLGKELKMRLLVLSMVLIRDHSLALFGVAGFLSKFPVISCFCMKGFILCKNT